MLSSFLPLAAITSSFFVIEAQRDGTAKEMMQKSHSDWKFKFVCYRFHTQCLFCNSPSWQFERFCLLYSLDLYGEIPKGRNPFVLTVITQASAD